MAHYQLTGADIGQPTLSAFGRVWMVSGFLGRVRPADVGKRVYLSGEVLQVESDAQRDGREGGE